MRIVSSIKLALAARMGLILGMLVFGATIITAQGINGGEHPEQIPDSVAYRLWFTRLGHALDDEAKEPGITASTLLQTGLSETDQSVVRGEVISWWKNYLKIVADYHAANVAAGTVTPPVRVAYKQSVVDLTMTTAQSIKTSLSQDGATRFYAFIVSGQEESNPQKPHGTRRKCDECVIGEENPELIPDSVAYRSWFSRVFRALDYAKDLEDPNAPIIDMFSDVDGATLRGIILTWQQQEEELVSSYKAKVEEAYQSGTNFDNAIQHKFAHDQAELALATAKMAKEQLSSDGAASFEAFVQISKGSISMSDEGNI